MPRAWLLTSLALPAKSSAPATSMVAALGCAAGRLEMFPRVCSAMAR